MTGLARSCLGLIATFISAHDRLGDLAQQVERIADALEAMERVDRGA